MQSASVDEGRTEDELRLNLSLLLQGKLTQNRSMKAPVAQVFNGSLEKSISFANADAIEEIVFSKSGDSGLSREDEVLIDAPGIGGLLRKSFQRIDMHPTSSPNDKVDILKILELDSRVSGFILSGWMTDGRLSLRISSPANDRWLKIKENHPEASVKEKLNNWGNGSYTLTFHGVMETYTDLDGRSAGTSLGVFGDAQHTLRRIQTTELGGVPEHSGSVLESAEKDPFARRALRLPSKDAGNSVEEHLFADGLRKSFSDQKASWRVPIRLERSGMGDWVISGGQYHARADNGEPEANQNVPFGIRPLRQSEVSSMLDADGGFKYVSGAKTVYSEDGGIDLREIPDNSIYELTVNLEDVGKSAGDYVFGAKWKGWSNGSGPYRIEETDIAGLARHPNVQFTNPGNVVDIGGTTQPVNSSELISNLAYPFRMDAVNAAILHVSGIGTRRGKVLLIPFGLKRDGDRGQDRGTGFESSNAFDRWFLNNGTPRTGLRVHEDFFGQAQIWLPLTLATDDDDDTIRTDAVFPSNPPYEDVMHGSLDRNRNRNKPGYALTPFKNLDVAAGVGQAGRVRFNAGGGAPFNFLTVQNEDWSVWINTLRSNFSDVLVMAAFDQPAGSLSRVLAITIDQGSPAAGGRPERPPGNNSSAVEASGERPDQACGLGG